MLVHVLVSHCVFDIHFFHVKTFVFMALKLLLTYPFLVCVWGGGGWREGVYNVNVVAPVLILSLHLQTDRQIFQTDVISLFNKKK